MLELKSRHLFDIDLAVEPLLDIHNTPGGMRRVVKVNGGSFMGERMRGTVLDGGGDWIVVRADGVALLDVRLQMRTDDGHAIYMRYRGMRHGPEAVIRRLNAGESVDPGEYYFRTAPVFEAPPGPYEWLNHILAVGVGDRRPSGPFYSVHEIL